MKNKLPPKKIDIRPFEKDIAPSIDVLVKLLERDDYPKWAIGRYLYGIQEWQVAGMSYPEVIGWALFPESINNYCEGED